jgi:hypothetical protein
MKEQDVNEIEVKGAIVTRPFEKNDPVAYIKDKVHYQGKIENIDKDGNYELKIYNNKNVKSLTVPSGEKLQPLFLLDKEQKMVYLKFTFDDVKAALGNKADIKVEFPKDKNYFTSLMLGNKTDVLSIEKNIDGSLKPVEGRLQMKRMAETNLPYLSADVKFKELNLDRPIYGKVLDADQKEKLIKTGELGLVKGFSSTEGKEFNLWVSLDSKLNKVVTARENQIYIGKIFGVIPNEKQLEELKSGKGTVMEIKGKNYFIQPSAASNNADGIKNYTVEKAKELKLIHEEQEEKKNDKSKGAKLK